MTSLNSSFPQTLPSNSPINTELSSIPSENVTLPNHPDPAPIETENKSDLDAQINLNFDNDENYANPHYKKTNHYQNKQINKKLIDYINKN